MRIPNGHEDLPALEALLAEARALRAAGVRATINDIARIARVSKKTVSRVINDSPLVTTRTREIVDQVIAELEFTPDPQARALALGRSGLVGLVYDNPSPQYVVNIQRGVLDGLAESGFQLVLQPCDRTDAAYRDRVCQFVTRHKPFGLILPPSVSEDEALIDRLRDLKVDYVRIASVDIDEPRRMIRTEDAEGSAQAARHLASLGHKRIAHVHGPKSFRSAHERRAGFERGLAEFGLTLAPELVIEGGYTFDSGLKAAERLIYGAGRPTALFAGNDEMATGAYVAARKAGLRIPEDISVVGFDDTPIAARLWPAMTTVRLPIRELGQAAARLLLSASNGASPDRTLHIRPEIVVRDSSAAPSG